MRKRVYVAGPISLGPIRENIRTATVAGMKLLKAGYAPLVPHLTCYMGGAIPESLPGGTKAEDWYQSDLSWVRCLGCGPETAGRIRRRGQRGCVGRIAQYPGLFSHWRLDGGDGTVMPRYAPLKTWIPVESSNLKKVRYDAETEILAITFDPEPHKGPPRTYGYSGVPMRVFLDLLDAPSKGKYHAKHIKWSYAYAELTDF